MPSNQRLYAKRVGSKVEAIKGTGGKTKNRTVTKVALVAQGKNYKKDYGKPTNSKGEVRR